MRIWRTSASMFGAPPGAMVSPANSDSVLEMRRAIEELEARLAVAEATIKLVHAQQNQHNVLLTALIGKLEKMYQTLVEKLGLGPDAGGN